MIHVGRDHVQDRALPPFSLRALYGHFFQPEDVFVREHLEQLDLSQRCDGKAVFLVVHQDLLERKNAACNSMPRFVHFSESSLAQLLQHLILADFGASFETALQGLLGRRT